MTVAQKSSWESLLDENEENGERVAELLQAKLHLRPSSEHQEAWRQEIQALLDRIPSQHLTHHLLRRIERHKFRVRSGISFHRYMVEESETRKMGLKSPGWALNRKNVAYRFIDALDIRRPNTEAEPSVLDEVRWVYPGVLKAAGSTGSRGCYLLYAENDIVHVRDGRQFSSQKEVLSHARQLMSRGRGHGIRDRWFTEELILEDRQNRIPARDLKFFCFYGQVLFTLEVMRTNGESWYSFRLPDGEPTKPGSWDYNYFDGRGATGSMINAVSSISEHIPHPFMRIDMLCGEDELVFGEFTPRPGGFQRFSPIWDRRLGEAWARAENTIHRDLLTGKRFDAFLSATGL